MIDPRRIEQCPVEYLRDSAVIANSLCLDRVDIIRTCVSSEPGIFQSLGSIYSQMLEADIPVGVKMRSNGGERVLEEIAIAEELIRKDPSLRLNLPLFVIGLRISGRPAAILTEDFSEDGRFIVEEDRRRIRPLKEADEMPTEIHRRVYSALQGNIVNNEAIGHMTSVVCGRTLLIDFNDIAMPDPYYGDLRELRQEVDQFQDIAFFDLD